MRELFIYYRVPSAEVSALRAAVFDLQLQLRSRYPQLSTRLLCRSDEADGRQTWMETYATDPVRDPIGVSAEMQADIERRALALLPMIDGSRHTEVFVACAS